MSLFRCLLIAYHIYKNRHRPMYYFAVTHFGVPQATVVFAQGREAWRLSVFAVDYKQG